MMKKASFYLLGYLFTLIVMTSCEYDFIHPEPVVIPTDTSISFKDKIEPIFNNNSNCTSCHSGSLTPDLRTGKAYGSINNATYINHTTPESSKIYAHPSPQSATHQQKKYTAVEAATILEWIKQGAKNN